MMAIVPWATEHYCQGHMLAFSKCRANLPVWSIIDHLSKGIIAFPLVWDVEWLKNMRKGCVIPTYSGYRSLQVQEAFFLQISIQVVNFKKISFFFLLQEMKHSNLKYNYIQRH